MGPRSFNRGNFPPGGASGVDGQRFNGAAVIQPRKRPQRPGRRRRLPGFNGAAVIQPRKPPCAECSSACPPGWLQWGRGHSTAETTPRKASIARSRRSFNGAAVIQPRKRVVRPVEGLLSVAASMGPRSFNRGNLLDCIQRYDKARASMGPRSFNRGNEGIGIHARGDRRWLQWGRGHSTAETKGS